MAALMLLLLASLALAACPWAGKTAPTVSTTMTTVSLNGTIYPVRGKAAREAFKANLHACGADAAIEPFEKWRRHRRQVNINVAVGIPAVVVGTVLVAVSGPAGGLLSAVGAIDLSILLPIQATQADKQRRAMVSALQISKPPRK